MHPGVREGKSVPVSYKTNAVLLIVKSGKSLAKTIDIMCNIPGGAVVVVMVW